MTFEIERAYPDATGRRWYVACKATVEGRKVLNVVLRNMGAPPVYGIAVVEDEKEKHATVY